MITYGIMQGRLTPEQGRGIQFFPFDNWKQEFFLAKELDLDEIEWIFDYERYMENPIWTQNGRNEIVEIIKTSGVRVKSVCFDYFMRHPFYKYENIEKGLMYQENIDFISTILKGMVDIGASIIEIPIVDNSSITSETEQRDLTMFLREVSDLARKYHIFVGLETDFRPFVFKEYLDSFHGKIYANYDSGNSSGLGYKAEDELLSLNQYVLNVHIKDRIFQGTTQSLGTGSANFSEIFQNLKKINYSGSFILQAARGLEGNEKVTIMEQIRFTKDYVEKYLCEIE